MKTALESYMETITVQEKTKILTEQELCQLQQTPNIDTILEYIQNGIDLSIRAGEFQRITRLIETNIYTKYNGVLSGWQLLVAKNNWTDYNVKFEQYNTKTITIDVPKEDGSGTEPVPKEVSGFTDPISQVSPVSPIMYNCSTNKMISLNPIVNFVKKTSAGLPQA